MTNVFQLHFVLYVEVLHSIILLLHLVELYFGQFQGTVRVHGYVSRLICLQGGTMWLTADNCQKQNAYANLKINKLTPTSVYFCFRKNILIKKCMGMYSIFIQNIKFLRTTPMWFMQTVALLLYCLPTCFWFPVSFLPVLSVLWVRNFVGYWHVQSHSDIHGAS